MKWFTVCFLIRSLYALENEGCKSPQYLELHQTGTIQCTLEEDSGIHWYNSTDTVKELPILNFRGSSKSGIGFTSGEYDVHPNGSLVINNVTVLHERNFTVVKLNAGEEIPSQYIIDVFTIVRPHQDFPLIENCDVQNRACLLHANETVPITCVVRDARPTVSLNWIVRTIPDGGLISSVMTVNNDDTTRCTSHISTNVTFKGTSFLQLFVCEAVSEPSLLKFSEAYVLVQKGGRNFSGLKSVTRYFKLGSKMELFCSEDDISFLAWSLISNSGGTYESGLLGIYVKDGIQEAYLEDFEVSNRSSLIVHHVEIGHEGKYGCVYGDGFNDGSFVYEVAVFVDPSPAYPIIDGCEDERYCILDLGNKGMLTCFIHGIRPEVQLLLRPLYDSSPGTISFYGQKTSIKTNGDTFDITVTTFFSFNNPQSNRVAVECKTIGPNADLFDFSAAVDLRVSVDKENTSDSSKPLDGERDGFKSQLLYLLLLPVFIILGVVIAVFVKVSRKGRRCVDDKEKGEENLPMFEDKNRPFSQPVITDKKKIFIQELKIKYQNLYDSVQPIPYIKEKLYCVNSLYIEGDIEAKVRRGNDQTEHWESVDLYHQVVTDAHEGPRRVILQGDAGYGKSTFALQLTYEWCKEIESPLKEVDILILLKLRQLGGTSSIYEAVRQSLLPKDSKLEEDDIKTIFQNTSLMLIIFDGYDEYPNQEDKTDVNHIIKRDMLQQIPVILTTRSSCLPNDYPPQTKHFKLNGFDETARERYIQKVVVGDDTEAGNRIKQRLIENPVLVDLCQVPLFFAMFAHMTHERAEFQSFNSVTSFFSYMISCFHGHMRNKLKDKSELQQFQHFEADHRKLDKFALDALCSEKKQIVWDRNDIVSSIGQQLYEHYVRIGILVEDEVLDMDKGPGIFQYKIQVTFYHKIFCEWYAAHLLSEHAASESFHYLRQILKQLDPFEHHYVYRFACGIRPEAATHILEYLKSIAEGQEFSVLCILEQTGKVAKITDTVTYLSSDVVALVNKGNRLQLRSTIQILEIASCNAIPIPCVFIDNCFQKVDCITWNISLGSGLFLSNLSSMIELKFYEIGRELRREEVEDIFRFSSQCLSLKSICFDSCVLPWSITTKKDPADLNSNEISVIWNPVGKWYRWNSNLECWEHRHEEVAISQEEYEEEVKRFRNEWSHTHWQNSNNDSRTIPLN